MKESLFDILNSHPNWEADIMELATNREACATLDKEIRQAAAMYADSLLPLADRWQKAVENDINQIFTTEPPHTHFNKDRQKRYKLTIDYFIVAVKQALKGHDFDISQLDRVTQYRLGEYLAGWGERGTQIEDGLTRDEANRLLHKMRKQGFRAQYFRELCSNLYTVFAYKDEASQTMPTDTPPTAGQMGEAEQEPESDTPPQETPLPTDLPIGVLPGILDTQMARRVFGKAIEKGYMKKYDAANKFEWIGVTDRGRNVQLAYLCGKIYGYKYDTYSGNIGNQFPETELKELFDIKNLQQSLFQFYDRRAAKRQKWIDKLDELFD